MYLIKSKSDEEVREVATDIDALDDFEHLDLGNINTLELSEINQESTNWASGEPIAFNEEAGMVLLPFSKSALVWLKDNTALLEEYGSSKSAALKFCENHSGNLYCLDTF